MPREAYHPLRSLCDHMGGEPVHAVGVWELIGQPKRWTRESIEEAAADLGVRLTTVRDVPWMVTMTRIRRTNGA